MRFALSLALAAALALLSTPALASKGSQEVARKLATEIQPKELYEQALVQMEHAMVESVRQLVPAEAAGAEALMRKMNQRVHQVLTYDVMMDAFARQLAEHFTTAELEELRKLFAQPVAKKLVKLQPQMTAAMMGEVMTRLQGELSQIVMEFAADAAGGMQQ